MESRTVLTTKLPIALEYYDESLQTYYPDDAYAKTELALFMVLQTSEITAQSRVPYSTTFKSWNGMDWSAVEEIISLSYPLQMTREAMQK